MAISQNGWPVGPPRTLRTVPGSTVKLTVANGPAGDVLMHVCAEFDRRVEDIDWRSSRGELDDWGYANRPIRGSTVTSNHASGTAVDLNATRHPLGARGTFTAKQADEIHRILREVDNVVRWGGDYTGRADEMHFEINANYARVAAVAARLGDDLTPDQDRKLSDIHWQLLNKWPARIDITREPKTLVDYARAAHAEVTTFIDQRQGPDGGPLKDSALGHSATAAGQVARLSNEFLRFKNETESKLAAILAAVTTSTEVE